MFCGGASFVAYIDVNPADLEQSSDDAPLIERHG